MLKSTCKALILGAPGSGKGTISSRIVKHFNMKHISSGDILRKEMLIQSVLGVECQHFVNSGKLVPDSLMMPLILKELSLLEDFNWILDGFPRTVEQVKTLLEKEEINVAINLDVPFEVIIDRVKGRWIHEASGRIYNMEFKPPKIFGKDDITGEELIQRLDDQPESVLNRLTLYSNTITPVLDYCDKVDILKNFTGKTSNEIWPHVFNFLSSKIPPKFGVNESGF